MIFQALCQRLRLKERLATAMSDVRAVAHRPQNLVMMLVVHLLLGFRRLRERDDPLVQRVLGLQRCSRARRGLVISRYLIKNV